MSNLTNSNSSTSSFFPSSEHTPAHQYVKEWYNFYEMCKNIKSEKDCKEVVYFFNKGNKDYKSWLWSYGMAGACKSGNISLLIKYFSDFYTHEDEEEKNNQNFKNKHIKSYQKFYQSNQGLYNACYNGNKDLVIYFINEGANDWNLGLRGSCINGNLELVQMMLDRGADDLESALNNAVCSNHKHIVFYLILKGADVNKCNFIFSESDIEYLYKHGIRNFLKYKYVENKFDTITKELNKSLDDNNLPQELCNIIANY